MVATEQQPATDPQEAVRRYIERWPRLSAMLAETPGAEIVGVRVGNRDLTVEEYAEKIAKGQAQVPPRLAVRYTRPVGTSLA